MNSNQSFFTKIFTGTIGSLAVTIFEAPPLGLELRLQAGRCFDFRIRHAEARLISGFIDLRFLFFIFNVCQSLTHHFLQPCVSPCACHVVGKHKLGQEKKSFKRPSSTRSAFSACFFDSSIFGCEVQVASLYLLRMNKSLFIILHHLQHDPRSCPVELL